MTDSTNDASEMRLTQGTDHAAAPAGGVPNPAHAGVGRDGLLSIIANLSKYHREHEKYYSGGTARRRDHFAARGAHADGTRGTMDNR